MATKHGNLADPDYEPSDEELAELVRSAFADVAAKKEAALRKVHQEIAQRRVELMREYGAPARSEPKE